MERDYRAIAKMQWTLPDEQTGTYQSDIQTGALLRIADACDAMAKDRLQMEHDRDRFKKWYYDCLALLETERRRSAALRGIIKRLKK